MGALTDGSGHVTSLVSGVQYCRILLYKYHCRSRLNRDGGTIGGKSVVVRNELSFEDMLYGTSGSSGSDVFLRNTIPGESAENLKTWYLLIPLSF